MILLESWVSDVGAFRLGSHVYGQCNCLLFWRCDGHCFRLGRFGIVLVVRRKKLVCTVLNYNCSFFLSLIRLFLSISIFNQFLFCIFFCPIALTFISSSSLFILSLCLHDMLHCLFHQGLISLLPLLQFLLLRL